SAFGAAGAGASVGGQLVAAAGRAVAVERAGCAVGLLLHAAVGRVAVEAGRAACSVGARLPLGDVGFAGAVLAGLRSGADAVEAFGVDRASACFGDSGLDVALALRGRVGGAALEV